MLRLVGHNDIQDFLRYLYEGDRNNTLPDGVTREMARDWSRACSRGLHPLFGSMPDGSRGITLEIAIWPVHSMRTTRRNS
jgi:hypothetical protein